MLNTKLKPDDKLGKLNIKIENKETRGSALKMKKQKTKHIILVD